MSPILLALAAVEPLAGGPLAAAAEGCQRFSSPESATTTEYTNSLQGPVTTVTDPASKKRQNTCVSPRLHSGIG